MGTGGVGRGGDPAVPVVGDVGELVARVELGERFEYLQFWGHRAPKGGGVGRSCLSQWWPAPFTVDGHDYPTAEHYMMVGKALLFGDEQAAEAVRAASSPDAAKQAGRRVRGFDEERWARHRFDIVVAGNRAKFGRHEPLRAFLLATGERVLVEASPLDRVWGIGLSADDPRAAAPQTWLGANFLGFALMRVRDELRRGCESRL